MDEMAKFRELGIKYGHQGRGIAKKKCIRSPHRDKVSGIGESRGKRDTAQYTREKKLKKKIYTITSTAIKKNKKITKLQNTMTKKIRI